MHITALKPYTSSPRRLKYNLGFKDDIPVEKYEWKSKWLSPLWLKMNIFYYKFLKYTKTKIYMEKSNTLLHFDHNDLLSENFC